MNVTNKLDEEGNFVDFIFQDIVDYILDNYFPTFSSVELEDAERQGERERERR
jgi:hypothetical protein